MKKVKALVAFSNGVIAMEQYEVRELPTDMANDLIAAGICVEISGGGSGGGTVVHAVISGSTVTLDKTWQEIYDGDYAVIANAPTSYTKSLMMIAQVTHEGTYYVTASNGQTTLDFYADSASGYPSATMG